MSSKQGGMIKSVSFYSEVPGPRLLVLGAIHGDEKCGTAGINRIIPEIERGDIKLKCGQVTFVPVCNPRAYAKNVRYIDRNLNRDMVRARNPKIYEAKLSNILVPMIEACDVLLDIHSYHAGGPAFTVLNEGSPRYVNFAAALGSSWIISGWTKAYLASAPKGGTRSKTEHIGTTECAYENGAIDVALECGQHLDPKAPQIAYDGIRRAMAYLKMADFPDLKPLSMPQRAELKEVVYSDGKGTFARPWRHLDIARAGELIATRGNGSVLKAKKDSTIILPRVDAPRGDEWFYLGELRRGGSKPS